MCVTGIDLQWKESAITNYMVRVLAHAGCRQEFTVLDIERIRGPFCDDVLYKLTFTFTFGQCSSHFAEWLF